MRSGEVPCVNTLRKMSFTRLASPDTVKLPLPQFPMPCGRTGAKPTCVSGTGQLTNKPGKKNKPHKFVRIKYRNLCGIFFITEKSHKDFCHCSSRNALTLIRLAEAPLATVKQTRMLSVLPLGESVTVKTASSIFPSIVLFSTFLREGLLNFLPYWNKENSIFSPLTIAVTLILSPALTAAGRL